MVFCLSSGVIYLSLGIPLSCPFVTVSELFCCELFVTFVTLSAILLPIKSLFDSAVFRIFLFEAIASAPVPDSLAWSRNFWLCLPLKFLLKR